MVAPGRAIRPALPWQAKLNTTRDVLGGHDQSGFSPWAVIYAQGTRAARRRPVLMQRIGEVRTQRYNAERTLGEGEYDGNGFNGLDQVGQVLWTFDIGIQGYCGVAAFG